MNCSRCSKEISEKQSYVSGGKIFCEDCLMDIGLSTKECDPWASYVETSARKRHGDTGTEGLNATQARIYEYIKGKGKATRQEVMEKLGIGEDDLAAQIIPLMHSELVKERSEGNKMYLILIG